MNFASDNWAGAAPEIAAALSAEAERVAPSYGVDPLTKAVEAEFARIFEREVAVFFVASGTATNALALSAFARPGGLAFGHVDAHVNTDEAGAAEFLANLKMIGLDGPAGKIGRAELAAAMARYAPNANRHGQPVVLSLSQLTELGTAYSVPEIGALASIARDAGLAVHMDGARFGNAVEGTGASPAELTWKAGVDVLSFGGTKGGCWQAEAVVFFDPGKARDFQFIRKRSGHLISKARFVAAQFKAYLGDDLWLRLAGHSNAMATRLAEGVVASGGRVGLPVDGNEVFPILPRQALRRLRDAGAKFYDWAAMREAVEQPGPDEGMIRLVTSFATSDEEVERFVGLLR